MQETTGRTESIEVEHLNQEAMAEGVSQVGAGIIVILACLIGAWGLACLVGGINHAGNLMELTRGWLAAVTGM